MPLLIRLRPTVHAPLPRCRPSRSPLARAGIALAGLGVLLLGGSRAASAQSRAGADASAVVSGPADTVVLSIADVRRLTVRQNPVFLAARQETAVARGELLQARAFFNPDLSLQVPGAAAGRGRGATELTLVQEFEVAGQRGLRAQAAQTGVARATASVENAGRLALADASTAFYRALAANGRLEVAREILELNGRLLEAVRVQLREGKISTLEANLAEIELGRTRARVLGARRAATSAELELRQLVGLDPEVPIRLEGETGHEHVVAVQTPAPVVAASVMAATGAASDAGLPDPAQLDADSLMALALARRPDLAAGTAAVREIETLTSLARRQALPNLRVGAFVERQPGDGPTTVGPAIAISLPLFNRYRGVVAQRQAQGERARLERVALELRVRTEVTNATRAYQTVSEEIAVLAQSALRPARENSALLEVAFRAGKVSLPTLLLLRNQLLDAELGYYDVWLAQREALVRLDAATGALAVSDSRATNTSPRTPR